MTACMWGCAAMTHAGSLQFECHTLLLSLTEGGSTSAAAPAYPSSLPSFLLPQALALVGSGDAELQGRLDDCLQALEGTEGGRGGGRGCPRPTPCVHASAGEALLSAINHAAHADPSLPGPRPLTLTLQFPSAAAAGRPRICLSQRSVLLALAQPQPGPYTPPHTPSAHTHTRAHARQPNPTHPAITTPHTLPTGDTPWAWAEVPAYVVAIPGLPGRDDAANMGAIIQWLHLTPQQARRTLEVRRRRRGRRGGDPPRPLWRQSPAPLSSG